MAKYQDQNTRYCPGEEEIRISDAVCLGRRRANYFKCPGCQFNDDERGTPSFTATVVGQTHKTTMPSLPEQEAALVAKVFKAYDIRATVPEPLTEDIAWRVGNGAAQFLRTSLSGYDRSDIEMNKLIVGRDMRTSSYALCRALIEGIVATSTPVIDIGLVDTPQVYFASNYIKCCGGVMTTASHNPENYNGFKICGPKGKPIAKDSGLQEIARIAAAISHHRVERLENVEAVDLTQPYREFHRNLLTEPRPLKIVVDASNGMAGKWFPLIFDGTPNLEIIPLNFEHDGTFVHPPNPLDPANLSQLQEAVRAADADLGACFDGDADRCILVDHTGEIVPCDLLTAALAAEYLRTNQGASIVYDVRSSRVVPETIERLGGIPKRQRVGHAFMKRTMVGANAIFGGEVSGHFYFRDFWYCDSAFVAFVVILNALARTGKSLQEWISPYRKYVSTGERNYINDERESTYEALIERFADARIDRLDGITVEYEDWWFNLRASNTEPLLRLNLEAASQALLDKRLDELTPILGRPE